jgi:hypothetical protein
LAGVVFGLEGVGSLICQHFAIALKNGQVRNPIAQARLELLCEILVLVHQADLDGNQFILVESLAAQLCVGGETLMDEHAPIARVIAPLNEHAPIVLLRTLQGRLEDRFDVRLFVERPLVGLGLGILGGRIPLGCRQTGSRQHRHQRQANRPSHRESSVEKPHQLGVTVPHEEHRCE